MSSHLVIFDIDGTLTKTRFIDKECYDQSLSDVLGLVLSKEQRDALQGSADSGLFNEVVSLFLTKSTHVQELQTFKETFFGHLEKSLRSLPNLQIKGASQLLERLSSLPNLKIALATGAWKESAALKLRYANIDYEEIALYTADEGDTKTDILEIAYCNTRSQDLGDRAFYVGDRHFDFLAAKALGMGFIGIGDDETLLQYVDPSQCLNDLTDVNHFLKLIAYE